MTFNNIKPSVIPTLNVNMCYFQNGKNWIFLHNQTRAHSDTIAQYLLKRILVNGATFELKLYLIYLINDVLHHW